MSSRLRSARDAARVRVLGCVASCLGVLLLGAVAPCPWLSLAIGVLVRGLAAVRSCFIGIGAAFAVDTELLAPGLALWPCVEVVYLRLGSVPAEALLACVFATLLPRTLSCADVVFADETGLLVTSDATAFPTEPCAMARWATRSLTLCACCRSCCFFFSSSLYSFN